MYNRLVEFFENNNILEEEQHGFRQNRSVITAATKFIESVIKDIDKKKKVIAILMDLTKAFDRVCHLKLIKELQICGINGLPLKWLESFIKGRKQFVEVKCVENGALLNYRSSLRELNYSVPQGSVLGPLLFICYFRGLSKKLNQIKDNNKLFLYADDSTLQISEQLPNTKPLF